MQITSPVPLMDNVSLTATPNGLLINWSQFTQFNIDLWKSTDGTNWNPLNVDYTKGIFTDSNCSNNTTYQYRFEIQDSSGFMYCGPALSVTTMPLPPPPPPTPSQRLPRNLIAMGVTQSSVALHWNTMESFNISLVKSTNGGPFVPLPATISAGQFTDQVAVSSGKPTTYTYMFNLANVSGVFYTSAPLNVKV